MLDEFRLKVFMAVAQEKSFTKAAAVLGVTQPAVSQNIAELEKGLGVKLFERQKGETVLSDEGKVFSIYADRMLQNESAAANMFAKLAPAVVKVSASEEVYTYILGPALETFSKIHPEISFERCLFGDADLVLSLKPSTGSPYDIPADSIARIRMSIFPTPKLGDLSATQEKTSYFEVLYQPSQTFACTRLCRLIKELIIT